jgi:hypothetical protein
VRVFRYVGSAAIVFAIFGALVWSFGYQVIGQSKGGGYVVSDSTRMSGGLLLASPLFGLSVLALLLRNVTHSEIATWAVTVIAALALFQVLFTRFNVAPVG